jgi:predicted kinase
MIKICEYCKKSFTAQKKTKQYCSTSCRVYAHREKHGISEPEFLKGVSGTQEKISDVEWEYVDVPITKQIKKPNPEYLEVSEILNQSEQKVMEISNQHRELAAEYAKVAEKAKIFEMGGLGAGLLLGAAFMPKKSGNLAEMILTLGAFAGGGYILGQQYAENMKINAKQKIIEIEDKMQKLSIEFNSMVFEVEALKRKKSTIREHIIQTIYTVDRIKKEIQKEKTDKELNKNLKQPIEELNKLLENSPIRGVSANEFLNMEFDTLKLHHPYNSFLGDIGEPFTVMIYGTPGAGKSTFALQFVNYLANNFGRVLVLSTEEGITKSMQDKVKQHELNSENLIFAEHTENIIKMNLIGYRFILIDSVNDARLSPENLKELRNKYPKTCFILIFQSTKAGEFKGNQSYLHDVDIQIKVDNGKATTEKNRYLEKGKEFIIYNTAVSS